MYIPILKEQSAPPLHESQIKQRNLFVRCWVLKRQDSDDLGQVGIEKILNT